MASKSKGKQQQKRYVENEKQQKSNWIPLEPVVQYTYLYMEFMCFSYAMYVVRTLFFLHCFLWFISFNGEHKQNAWKNPIETYSCTKRSKYNWCDSD